jgi:GNAT superfamily N-acetyltransferase
MVCVTRQERDAACRYAMKSVAASRKKSLTLQYEKWLLPVKELAAFGKFQALTIRDANATDVESLAHLHAASWRAAYRGILSDHYLDQEVLADRLTVWRNRFAHPKANQRIFVAEIDGSTVGFACCFGAEHERYGTLLDHLHVSPEQKRRGIGTVLMTQVATASVEAFPKTGLWLWVWERNAGARQFYESLSAVNVDTEMRATPDGRAVKGLRMHWADPTTLYSP